jgi:uncharacterized protein YbaP (TraB family)
MRLRSAMPLLVLTTLMVGAPLRAAPPPPSSTNVADLPAVLVTGVQPGPGMWRVSRDGHELWILGTLSPLPRGMTWQSREVESVIASAQQILLPPSVKMKVDTGWLGKLFLLPSAYSARKNEDGKTLQQVLSAPTYARWQALKQTYLNDKRNVERWRPIFAAQALYKAAIKANGLSNSGGVKAAVDALAKQHGVAETAVEYPVTIEHPRAAIKAFKQAAPNDVMCMSRTLDAIEHDLPSMKARANAWATGDLQALRELPDSNRRQACIDALADAGFARQLGIDDIPEKVQATWLAAARKALETNRQTFAMLSMDELLKPDGYLAKLRAEGYTVEAPLE